VGGLLTSAQNSLKVSPGQKSFPSFAQKNPQRGKIMALTVKSIQATTTKWAQRAGAAASDYANGVAGTQKDQAALAEAAEPTWAAGVASAASNHTFSAGLRRAGTAGWKAGVASKGASRYAPGVQASQAKFSTRFGTFLNVIAGLNLTPRFPRGDPRNQQRSVDVQTALHKARIGGV
jgi:hypothetical protein